MKITCTMLTATVSSLFLLLAVLACGASRIPSSRVSLNEGYAPVGFSSSAGSAWSSPPTTSISSTSQHVTSFGLLAHRYEQEASERPCASPLACALPSFESLIDRSASPSERGHTPVLAVPIGSAVVPLGPDVTMDLLSELHLLTEQAQLDDEPPEYDESNPVLEPMSISSRRKMLRSLYDAEEAIPGLHIMEENLKEWIDHATEEAVLVLMELLEEQRALKKHALPPILAHCLLRLYWQLKGRPTNVPTQSLGLAPAASSDVEQTIYRLFVLHFLTEKVDETAYTYDLRASPERPVNRVFLPLLSPYLETPAFLTTAAAIVDAMDEMPFWQPIRMVQLAEALAVDRELEALPLPLQLYLFAHARTKAYSTCIRTFLMRKLSHIGRPLNLLPLFRSDFLSTADHPLRTALSTLFAFLRHVDPEDDFDRDSLLLLGEWAVDWLQETVVTPQTAELLWTGVSRNHSLLCFARGFQVVLERTPALLFKVITNELSTVTPLHNVDHLYTFSTIHAVSDVIRAMPFEPELDRVDHQEPILKMLSVAFDGSSPSPPTLMVLEYYARRYPTVVSAALLRPGILYRMSARNWFFLHQKVLPQVLAIAWDPSHDRITEMFLDHWHVLFAVRTKSDLHALVASAKMYRNHPVGFWRFPPFKETYVKYLNESENSFANIMNADTDLSLYNESMVDLLLGTGYLPTKQILSAFSQGHRGRIGRLRPRIQQMAEHRATEKSTAYLSHVTQLSD